MLDCWNQRLISRAKHLEARIYIQRCRKKAAVLYYGLNKNHPFRNGNKRISVTALFTFLFINGYTFNVGDDDFVNKTLKVAKSDASIRASILKEIEAWIESNIVARTR